MNLKPLYARAFRRGKTDSIAIESEDGLRTATGVAARVRAAGSNELVGAVSADALNIIALGEDLSTYGEPRSGDLVRIKGRRYKIEGADPYERAQDGEALAYVLTVRG